MLSLVAAVVSVTGQRPVSEKEILLRTFQTAMSEGLAVDSKQKDRRSVYTLSQAGRILEGPNDTLALKCLNLAWIASFKESQKSGSFRLDIIRSMAAIDLAKANRLILKIPDEDLRSFAKRSLPEAIAYRRPHLAAKLFDRSDDSDAFETVRDLVQIRVDIGVSFLKILEKLKKIDVESSIQGMDTVLTPKENARFMAAIPLKKPRDESSYWLALHSNPSGTELERAAGEMTNLSDRIDLLLEAIGAYNHESSNRGKVIADQLCDLAQANGPKPIFRMKDYSFPLEWKYALLPKITQADTPKVRQFLERCLKTSDQYVGFSVCRAWSNIDIEKASDIADEIISKSPEARYGPHGQSVDSNFVCYLTNLTKVNPKRATDLLMACVFQPLSGSDKNEIDYSTRYAASEIIKALWQKYPKQAAEFCTLPSRWKNEFKVANGTIVDYLAMDHQARADPLNSEKLLRKINKGDSEGYHYLQVGAGRTARACISAVARIDQDKAIKLSEVVTDPIDRIEILGDAYEACRDLPFSKRSKILAKAFSLARSEPDSSAKVLGLFSVAENAKRSWQRLQPWPPAQ